MTVLKICCHSRAPRGNPPVGCTGETTTYCPALRRGSPLREDDGGECDPHASTVGLLPLRGGFHGLRPLNDGELWASASTLPQHPSAHLHLCTSFGGRDCKIFLSFRGSASDRRIPRLVAPGNDALSQTLLSFSRSARESPKWFHHGNDSVLPCPCVGDPRYARMTEEKATLTRPLLGACP